MSSWNFQLLLEKLQSATRALCSIIAKFKCLGGISYVTFQKLYDSSVQPILLYGAGIWGTREYKILNTVQNKACRFFLRVQKTASNIATRGDLGWSSLLCKQHLEVIRLWLRLKIMDVSRLTAKVFKYNCTQAITFRKRNWEYNVVKLFKSKDLEFLINIGNEINCKSILKECEQLLTTADTECWYRKLWDDSNQENGNKLRTYRLFKNELKIENYVTVNMPWYKKRYFAMLRAGCLPLEVEKGRHAKPKIPLIDRKCKMCNQNDVETEYHFVMKCQLYIDQRENMFCHYRNMYTNFETLSENDQFALIMSTGDYFTCKTIFDMVMRRNLFV